MRATTSSDAVEDGDASSSGPRDPDEARERFHGIETTP
ncbi:hypothetical protein J2X46_004092 [Nocardioides sp. BE266]|nr:hypothetical protein [Nocardioides sp. BE266]